MKPADVNKTNEYQVWTNLFGDAVGNFSLPKFRIGDTVRISSYKSIFSKGYEANFTEEIFKVKKVLRGDPNMYEIEDHEGEPIIGKFYEQELSCVNAKLREDAKREALRDDTYRVERVLKRKRHGVGKVVRVR